MPWCLLCNWGTSLLQSSQLLGWIPLLLSKCFNKAWSNWEAGTVQRRDRAMQEGGQWLQQLPSEWNKTLLTCTPADVVVCMEISRVIGWLSMLRLCLPGWWSIDILSKGCQPVPLQLLYWIQAHWQSGWLEPLQQQWQSCGVYFDQSVPQGLQAGSLAIEITWRISSTHAQQQGFPACRSYRSAPGCTKT